MQFAQGYRRPPVQTRFAAPSYSTVALRGNRRSWGAQVARKAGVKQRGAHMVSELAAGSAYIARRRAIRSSMGGWVAKRLFRKLLCSESGFTM